MEIFTLSGYEFIELNKLLKILQWANSGGQANTLITNGEVWVNGEIEIRKRKKMRAGDVVRLWDREAQVTGS